MCECKGEGGNGNVGGFYLISVRRGNRESDEPWLVLTRKGKEGEWIIQAAIIKNISVGLFSEIKVLSGVSRGPSPALNLGCGQGRRDCCIRRPYSFLSYLHCDPLFSCAFAYLQQSGNKRGHWNGVMS